MLEKYIKIKYEVFTNGVVSKTSTSTLLKVNFTKKTFHWIIEKIIKARLVNIKNWLNILIIKS